MDIEFERIPHEAMATTFEILVAGEEKQYARQAAAAAFAEIDRIEQRISRYIDTSDISQINHLAAGETARIGSEAFECLKAARRAYDETGGAFDPTVGPLMACWRNPDGSPRQPSDEEAAAARRRVGMDHLEFDDATHSVRVRITGLSIDLGGIGKGFATDKAALLLQEWDVDKALLSAGTSTVLALDGPPGRQGWPVGVGGIGDEPEPAEKIVIRRQALSGSGTYQKGRHIMDPRTGRPVADKIAVWALCPSGTMADALSTAFMVMTPEEVETYCRKHPDTSALLVLQADGKTDRVRFGPWVEQGPD